MDLVLEAEQVLLRGAHPYPGDDAIRTIIAAVYDSIYGIGYTDGFVDKGDLEG